MGFAAQQHVGSSRLRDRAPGWTGRGCCCNCNCCPSAGRLFTTELPGKLRLLFLKLKFANSNRREIHQVWTTWLNFLLSHKRLREGRCGDLRGSFQKSGRGSWRRRKQGRLTWWLPRTVKSLLLQTRLQSTNFSETPSLGMWPHLLGVWYQYQQTVTAQSLRVGSWAPSSLSLWKSPGLVSGPHHQSPHTGRLRQQSTRGCAVLEARVLRSQCERAGSF